MDPRRSRHGGKDGEINSHKSDEARHVVSDDCRHEVTSDVAVHDVKTIDRQCKHREEYEQADNLLAYFGAEQISHRTQKPASGLTIERSRLCAHTVPFAGLILKRLV